MTTTFSIEDEGGLDDPFMIHLNNANAHTLSEMIGIPLRGPDGAVGSLEPAELIPLMTRIETLMHSDLNPYVRAPSNVQQARGVAREIGNVVDLYYGPRFASPGTSVQYLEQRLLDFYLLFQRALELNKRVTWC
jgi:hypothetical protein